MIPVLDEEGRVVEMYGRKLRDDLREGTPTHLYLPGPHRGVWNVAALATSEEVIVCENRATVLWVYRKMRNGQPWHLRGVDVFTVRDGKVAAKLAYVKG